MPTTSVNGVDLAVTVVGDGPAVMLVHGFPRTGLVWSGVTEALARDHRVVVPDLRGSGDSTTCSTTAVTPSRWTARRS